jgi:hypothetical protein
LPPAPVLPTYDDFQTTSSQTVILWSPVTSTDVPVTGYILQMRSDDNLSYIKVYDGSNLPNIFTYSVLGLLPTKTY